VSRTVAGAASLAAIVSALTRARVFEALAAFDPHHVGTWPIGLAIESSDADIAVCAPDLDAFRAMVEQTFGKFSNFTVTAREGTPPALVTRFMLDEIPVEIFAAPAPVKQQNGWRHMMVEARLLSLAAAEFRTAVLTAKRDGLKNEPAFAHLLGLTSDPYEAVLALEPKSDKMLGALLESRGYLKPALAPQPPPHLKLNRPYTTKAPRKASSKSFS
jgi:hypothetical protein